MKKFILSNGLCILSAKKKTADLAILALTDFNQTEKVIFDTVEKKLVELKTNLKLKPSDIDLIQACLKSYEKQPLVIKESV